MAHPKKGALHQVLVPMVDSTDFASVESAITASDFNSGATVKFYGLNTGGSAATTSGTVSKIASLVRSGVFRITLKTTENNYDVMMLRINKTGCAEQILTWSNVDNDDSDIMSALTVIKSMASDAASAATQANSRILVNTSMTSDIASYLVAMSGMLSDVQSAVLITQSAASDTLSRCVVIASMASDAASAAQQANSRILVNTSLTSDIYSQLSDFRSDLGSLLGTTGVQLNASTLSDIRSAIAGVTATLSASDISDIASAVRAILVSDLSDIHSAATLGASRALVVQSMVSDTQSKLSDVESNLLSFLTTTGTGLNASTMSDIRSAIAGVTVTLDASAISDIASAVAAAVTFNVSASDMSDIASRVEVALASRLSDILSAATQTNSRVLVVQSLVSDVQSAVALLPLSVSASDMSDIASRVDVVLASRLSDILSAATQTNSRVLVVQSMTSDVQSKLSDVESNLLSLLTTTGVQMNASSLSDIRSALAAGVPLDASTMSDIRSAVAAVTVNLTASDISDIASAVAAAVTTINASDISDIASAVRAILASDLSDILSAAQQGNSRVLVVQSMASDAHSAALLGASAASDAHSAIVVVQSRLSDFDSRMVSDISDVRSQLTVIQSMASDAHSAALLGASAASDAHSMATVAASRALLNQSRISDVYSMLSGLDSEFSSRVPGNFSDMLSDIQVAADAAASRALVIRSGVSDVQSALAAGVDLGASALSDLRSVVAAHGVQRAGADITAVPAVTGTLADKVDWMFALSRNRVDQTSTQQKVYNDAASQIASAAVSDDGVTFQRGEWAG